jgi:hypothetical protein
MALRPVRHLGGLFFAVRIGEWACGNQCLRSYAKIVELLAHHLIASHRSSIITVRAGGTISRSSQYRGVFNIFGAWQEKVLERPTIGPNGGKSLHFRAHRWHPPPHCRRAPVFRIGDGTGMCQHAAMPQHRWQADRVQSRNV